MTNKHPTHARTAGLDAAKPVAAALTLALAAPLSAAATIESTSWLRKENPRSGYDSSTHDRRRGSRDRPGPT